MHNYYISADKNYSDCNGNQQAPPWNQQIRETGIVHGEFVVRAGQADTMTIYQVISRIALSVLHPNNDWSLQESLGFSGGYYTVYSFNYYTVVTIRSGIG